MIRNVTILVGMMAIAVMKRITEVIITIMSERIIIILMTVIKPD